MCENVFLGVKNYADPAENPGRTYIPSVRRSPIVAPPTVLLLICQPYLCSHCSPAPTVALLRPYSLRPQSVTEYLAVRTLLRIDRTLVTGGQDRHWTGRVGVCWVRLGLGTTMPLPPAYRDLIVQVPDVPSVIYPCTPFLKTVQPGSTLSLYLSIGRSGQRNHFSLARPDRTQSVDQPDLLVPTALRA